MLINNRKKNRYRSLAIIGNGFDLAHDYKTRYDQFAKSVGDDYFNKYKEFLTEYCGTDTKWSEFENRLGELVIAFYQHYFEDNANYEKIKNDNDQFNKWFQRLHDDLVYYLTKETQKNYNHKLKSVSKVLKKHTIGLNFNYTSVASRYKSPIIHVHGSLKENDIILGIDPINPRCIAPYEQERWQKHVCRQRLAFHRFVLQKIAEGDIDGQDFQIICQAFEKFEELSTSGRGMDERDLIGHEFESLYDEFFYHTNKQDIILENITFSKIKKIYVLGHGIIADKTFLSDILKMCTSLKRVVIFSYDKETTLEWEEKASFFKSYCKKL